VVFDVHAERVQMIGDRLRDARSARHWSLSDVAEKAHISAATLSRIENSKQSLDVGLFLLLLKILRIQAIDVLENDGNVSSGDRLVDQIVRLGGEDRIQLWKDLATSRRTQRSRKSSAREVGEKVEELVAQIEYLREEIEAVRAKRRR
jgi:transcriptional regulator with XRE-family HTH domain